METVELFSSEGKGRGLKAVKEQWAGDVIFAERAYAAVVFDRAASGLMGVSLQLPVTAGIMNEEEECLSQGPDKHPQEKASPHLPRCFQDTGQPNSVAKASTLLRAQQTAPSCNHILGAMFAVQLQCQCCKAWPSTAEDGKQSPKGQLHVLLLGSSGSHAPPEVWVQFNSGS
ncbi:UNVERIFIED_CONTAM: hypothetical protein K2H54_057009 [Gekko kuhli]